jgi:hypothetical protein
VSRRRRRGSRGDPRRQGTRPRSNGEESSGRGLGLLPQIGLLLAIFFVVTAIAELFGAANLGVALGVGQIAFAIAVVWMLLRGP